MSSEGDVSMQRKEFLSILIPRLALCQVEITEEKRQGWDAGELRTSWVFLLVP